MFVVLSCKARIAHARFRTVAPVTQRHNHTTAEERGRRGAALISEHWSAVPQAHCPRVLLAAALQKCANNTGRALGPQGHATATTVLQCVHLFRYNVRVRPKRAIENGHGLQDGCLNLRGGRAECGRALVSGGGNDAGCNSAHSALRYRSILNERETVIVHSCNRHGLRTSPWPRTCRCFSAMAITCLRAAASSGKTSCMPRTRASVAAKDRRGGGSYC